MSLINCGFLIITFNLAVMCFVLWRRAERWRRYAIEAELDAALERAARDMREYLAGTLTENRNETYIH